MPDEEITPLVVLGGQHEREVRDRVELNVAGKAEVGHRSDHLLIVVGARILEVNARLLADRVQFGFEIAIEQIGRFATEDGEKRVNRRNLGSVQLRGSSELNIKV